MKLSRLWIKEFKNLVNFEMDCQATDDIFVNIGLNGSGKSNFFEALSLIFRELRLYGEHSRGDYIPAIPFEFRLSYELAELGIVSVEYSFDRAERYRFRLNGQPLEHEKIDGHLANNLITYYSGTNRRLRSIYSTYESYHRKLLFKKEALREAEDETLADEGEASKSTIYEETGFLSRLFYLKSEHSKLALLSIYAYDYQAKDIKNLLSNYLGIAGIDSALFSFSRPLWYKNRADFGDKLYWSAPADVAYTVQALHRLSCAPILTEDGNCQHLFIESDEQLQRLSRDSEFPRSKKLFTALNNLMICRLLRSITLFVRMNDGTVIDFDELSEGEQQLILILGMIEVTNESKVLFLLDEPETALNPRWKYKLVELIKEINNNSDNEAGAGQVKKGSKIYNQLIINTHDPIVTSNLTKKDVFIFKNGNSPSSPEVDPQLLGVPGILTGEMYGLPSILGLTTLELLDRRRELAYKDELTPDEREELRQLNDRLKEIDLSVDNIRDPYYPLFVKAWREVEKREGFGKTSLEPEELDKRLERAIETLERLKRERELE